MDLIFPHHENEIAQSCAACPKSNVNYWIHNGFVKANVDKISKSLGNFFTIRAVTEVYHPLALRHFLMGTHYRSPVNYTAFQLEISSEAVFYIYQTLQECEDELTALEEEAEKIGKIGSAAQECITKLREEFEATLSDDLHTPTILNSSLPESLRFMNSSVNTLKKKQPKKQQLCTVKSLAELEKQIKQVLDVLGLLSNSSYTEVLQQLKDKALIRAGLTEGEVVHLMEERMLVRKNKEFSKSDQIRNDLAAKGISLMDVGKETVWRPCVPVQQEKPAEPVEKPVEPVEKNQQAVPIDGC